MYSKPQPENSYLLDAASILVVFLVFGFLLGCAKQPVKAKVVVPRECLVNAELGPKTECRGEDIQHMHCYNLVVTRKVGCERVEVAPRKP